MKCLGRRVGAESDVLIKQAINSKRLTSNNILGQFESSPSGGQGDSAWAILGSTSSIPTAKHRAIVCGMGEYCQRKGPAERAALSHPVQRSAWVCAREAPAENARLHGGGAERPLWSLRDIRERIRDVRFTPRSRHAHRRHQCLLSARS